MQMKKNILLRYDFQIKSAMVNISFRVLWSLQHECDISWYRHKLFQLWNGRIVMTLQNVRFRVHINFRALQDSHTHTTDSKWKRSPVYFNASIWFNAILYSAMHNKCNTLGHHIAISVCSIGQCNSIQTGHIIITLCFGRKDNPSQFIFIGCYIIK